MSTISYIVNGDEVPIKELEPGDKHFKFTQGLVEWPRAAIKISDDCPNEYKSIIQICISRGYVTPVAYIAEPTIMWDILKE